MANPHSFIGNIHYCWYLMYEYCSWADSVMVKPFKLRPIMHHDSWSDTNPPLLRSLHCKTNNAMQRLTGEKNLPAHPDVDDCSETVEMSPYDELNGSLSIFCVCAMKEKMAKYCPPCWGTTGKSQQVSRSLKSVWSQFWTSASENMFV